MVMGAGRVTNREAKVTRVTTLQIKSRDTEYILGTMAGLIKATSKMI